MISRLRNSARRLFARFVGSDGAEIVEFVVSLPLIMVTVVGIFDFGTAFVVRQKISNAALQGARVAANQPMTDLS
ncbi:MAG TPA: TadE family protein, partial [Terriglobales bacterium]|nr:TadE family protein [Terriglobales bacterium]